MTLKPGEIDGLEFSKGGGLLPAVVQDASSGAVLMLGYMDRAALEATLERRRVVFFSRSRERLWEKGETSGHYLELVDLAADCDRDTLLVLATRIVRLRSAVREDFAADIDAVRRHIGDPPVVLFGHSFGCQVALEGYRRRREKIRGLVLLCGSAGRVTHTFRGTDALAQILPGLIERVRANPLLARGLWGSVPPELSLRIASLTGEIDARLMDPRDLLPYLQHMADIDLLMFLRMLNEAGEHSAADLLPEIEVPVLVIGGDRDNFTPVRYAEELAKALPKGELLMLSATHVAPLEQRGAVHERIGAFLDKLAVTPP